MSEWLLKLDSVSYTHLDVYKRQVLLTAEQRVDALVIAGIVAVIGIRLKDRIEINGGNVQALQIIQLGVYAAQRAAEKVVVEDFAVLIRQIYRNIVPVLVRCV